MNVADSSSPRLGAPGLPQPRVLHCITGLQLGGAERMVGLLIEELHARYQFGVHTVRATVRDEVGAALQERLRSLSVPCFTGTRLPLKWGGLLPGAWALARAVREFRPQVIHLHTEIPEATYATMLLLRRAAATIPLVRTLHNSRYWEHWRRLGHWAEGRMPSAHVVGVSRAALDAYRLHAARCRGASRMVSLVANGVAVPENASFPRAEDDTVKLLFAGRFDRQKGIDLLPEILALTPPDPTSRRELTLIGAGPERAVVDRLVARPPRGWIVKSAPPRRDLERHLAEFDLVLMPSRFEGLSLLAMEALVRGIPVIGTAAPGLGEAFPRDYPWLARAGDAGDFARVLGIALASRGAWPGVMASVASDARSRFALPRMAAGYDAVYRAALASQ